VSRPTPPRLVAGLLLANALVLACLAGPMLLPRPAGTDPARTALVPPGATITILEMVDETVLASTQVTTEGDTFVVHDRVLGPTEVERERVRAVSRHRFLLGSDRFGRDVLLQLLEGGRLSLMIATFSLCVALLLGTLVGLMAATAGRVVDSLLMRMVDALLAFPLLILLILVVALFRPSPGLLVVVLGLTSWMGLARLVRGQVLSLRSRPFVLAARASGTRWHRIWRLHLLPHMTGPISQDAALRMGDLIIAEATLSYLGLGVPASTPTWGSMVSEGQKVMVDGWWLITFPGMAIALLVIALALIGDGLQETLADPEGAGG